MRLQLLRLLYKRDSMPDSVDRRVAACEVSDWENGSGEKSSREAPTRNAGPCEG